MVHLSTLSLAAACIHVLLGCGHALGAENAKNATRLQTLGEYAGAGQKIAQHRHEALRAKKRVRGGKVGNGKPLGTVSVDINVEVSIGGGSDTDYQLLSVEQLLPARENLHDAFNCYDKDGNHVLHGDLEIQGLQRHVADLVSSDEIARQLMQEADFRGDDGLDEVEFGTLIDLICWRLKIKICTALESGRRFHCEGTGAGSLQMLGSFQALADAHADLDASFRCFDLNGDGKLDEQERAELMDHLKTGLLFSNEQVADALTESDWGEDGFEELQFDCLLMMLQEAVEQMGLDVDAK